MTFLFNDSPSPSRRSGPRYAHTVAPTSAKSPARRARFPTATRRLYSEWRALAERIHADADRSAAKAHVSARESYCEQATTTGCAILPALGQPMTLSSAKWASSRSTASPRRATDELRARAVSFPYENTTLPGWWIPADLGRLIPRR